MPGLGTASYGRGVSMDPNGSAGPSVDGDGTPSKPSIRERAAAQRARAEDLKRKGTERLELERTRRSSVRMAFEFYERDKARAGNLLAGGIAFRLFLWLLPFSLVVVTILGYVTDLSDRRPDEVARDVGLSAAFASTVAHGVAGSDRARIVLLVIGIPLVLWAGMGVARGLRVVSGLAWRIRPKGRNLVKASAWVSTVVFALLALQVVAGRLYGGSLGADLGVTLLVVGCVTAIGVVVMSALPHAEDVPWTAMVPGALLASIGLEALRIATAVYFAGKLERIDDLYGALGVSAVFMTWLYLVARFTVTGIELNATLYQGRHPDPDEIAEAEAAVGPTGATS
jgi:membrane protein